MKLIKLFALLVIICTQVFSDVIQRGSIAFAIGGSGIAAYDYGESVLNNPACLPSIHKFEVDAQLPDNWHIGIFANPINHFVFGGSYRGLYKGFDSASVFSASLANKFFNRLSVGLNFKALGSSAQRIQKFGADIGILYEFIETFRIGGIWNSQAVIKLSDTLVKRLPQLFGVGFSWLFFENWELRNDYLLISNPFLNIEKKEYEIHCGIQRDFLFSSLYGKNNIPDWIEFSLGLIDRLIPHRGGLYLQNINDLKPTNDLHFTLGWGDIAFFSPASNGDVFNLQFGFDLSQNSTKFLCGITVGNRAKEKK
jgi:hypothetical protein